MYLYDDLIGPYIDAADALVNQCAADEKCNAAYPDLRATTNAAFEKLSEGPIPAARGRPEIDFISLFTQAFVERNKPAEKRPINAWLPRIFTELADGRTAAFDALMAATPPDRVKTLGETKGLTEDKRTLVRVALETVKAMGNLEHGVVAAIERLNLDLGDAREATSVAEAFEARSTQAALAIVDKDKDAVAAMLRDHALLQTRTPGPQPLIDWVTAHFRGADREALLRLIATMTEADIARTFEMATSQATKYEAVLRGEINQAIYACQEDVPYSSQEGFNARIADLAKRYPFVQAFAGETSSFDKCAYFEPHPREGFHDPVVSDVPVLALNEWVARYPDVVALGGCCGRDAVEWAELYLS